MNVRAWLDDPQIWRRAIQIGAALLIVVAIAVGAWAWSSRRESQGQAALAEAEVVVQQALAPQATPDARARAIQALEGVLQAHPRFSGAAQAAYQLGNLQYAAGQYAAARAAYATALAKGAPPSMALLSSISIGYTWEAEKNYGNAASAYEAALRSIGPKDFVYEDTLMALARVQELAGKPAAALETYQRILRDVPESRRADDLKTRVADLKDRSK